LLDGRNAPDTAPEGNILSHVTHKLNNAFEGALAGGGDPATSPLYVFGPFLKLIVVAGVAQVTFGASLWLVVLTVSVVSAMYRLVMSWITDGSGGSGLSEEEFGSWAVKLNASITFVEYTLTFLVSMAALVTFIADRVPLLNESLIGIQYRTLVAIALSLLTGWLVNRGPRVAALTFGPATGGVLLLLWVMVIATILRFGFKLPSLDPRAFSSEYIGYTFNGYVRILAVMTGIEVFANLVAAYDGTAAEKSRKAFGSLLIIMGTTSITMLIVGPAIAALADPLNPEVSVFTQTMDALLPAPLAFAGTLVGIAVLLSASAASAQGLQNLALGLKYRHYIPGFMGDRNAHGVADRPVWIEVAVVIFCFLLLGTNEETYLSIYAAGVFILLSMTGWAATKRLLRQLRERFLFGRFLVLIGIIVAALLTTGATLIIFGERFREGAWIYFVILPILFALFSYYRRQLGEPTNLSERMGVLAAARGVLPSETQPWSSYRGSQPLIQRLIVPLDRSPFSEQALPIAGTLAGRFQAPLTLVHVAESQQSFMDADNPQSYLAEIAASDHFQQIDVRSAVGQGDIVRNINRLAREHRADLLVMCSHGHSGVKRLVLGSVAEALLHSRVRPILIVPPDASHTFQRILVALDGSDFSEQALPYAETLAKELSAELLLLAVPQAPDEVQGARESQAYLNKVADTLKQHRLKVHTVVAGRSPAETIIEQSMTDSVDLIVLATRGRGGVARLLLGSVAGQVVRGASCPVLLVPA
jgi:nucleotide-binding universal stress UspA family protein